MEKKRSFGVSFFGITHILLGTVGAFCSFVIGLLGLIFPWAKEAIIKDYPSVDINIIVYACLFFVLPISVFEIIMGRGLLRLKPWAVKAILIFSSILWMFILLKRHKDPFDLLWLIYLGAPLVYFTRPKVKEQFK
ncbi:MAG: hypothetical protein ISS45_06840 [Candidatus Omnitrophica bacterium]|nr:hypothetical protein [Candidatus Omnitrophota bacterium]